MNTIEIKGSFRKELGKKSSKHIRKEGYVPCVIYDKENNLHFQVHENSFQKLVYTPEAHLVKLLIDDQEINAILQDIQFHPVTDKIIHADFMKIYDHKPIVISIPVAITGDSAGVKAGGKLIVKRRHLKVKGLAEHLPENLAVDISELKINHSIKVGDLAYDNIELLDPKVTTVVSIASSRVALKTEGEEAAEEETAEEEVAEDKDKEKKS